MDAHVHANTLSLKALSSGVIKLSLKMSAPDTKRKVDMECHDLHKMWTAKYLFTGIIRKVAVFKGWN